MSERSTNRSSNGTAQIPRSVRDGSLAAAIGAALTLALESNSCINQTSNSPVEAPWTGSSRIQMNYKRSGFQIQDTWGKLAGWKAAHGKWRALK
ncbi:MAG: hypothetical protein NTY09_07760 [bacterium]|nr:hypothetical protein [bacterium]